MGIKKRTVIKKRRVVRRTVSSSRTASPRKLVIMKVSPGQKIGRRRVLRSELPESTYDIEHKKNAGDSGWRRSDI